MQPKTVSRDAILRLADRLAWFRSSGFATASRMERFVRDLIGESRAAGCDPTALYDRISSTALAISEDNRRAAMASNALAVRPRRKAV